MSVPATERTVAGILVSVARFVNLLGVGTLSGAAVKAGGSGMGSIGYKLSYSYCKLIARII
ncbi:hypothetical protein [Microcoleus sp. bin38.metabat.b11b12b14.051]|uniref:hypothetical protein n=1 Tax=Microcoleus sp. bin38.metabat.b11b12b14.051 TaxID=2742709 RepID=UPI0025D07490|nr:hypothetical protein [Microcoleus sp. bin38.metabat.b11b12b14.051]